MADVDPQVIREFFARTPLLAGLCQQNGWPDADTVQVIGITAQEGGLVCSVSFEEILMEGSGCVAGRGSRWGQFALRVDASGGVQEARML